MNPIRLILASRSPRRTALLADAGYTFEQADPPFNDPAQPVGGGRSIADLAADLARRKALSLRNAGGYDNAVILAADTVCVGTDGSPIGQPRDRDDAEAMLRSFMNASHDVVTGVAILGPADPGPETFADTATVNIGHVPDAELQAYLNTDQWRGKAGGYNLFDRRDAGWPITVQGDETTVVGLPMERVADALTAHGFAREPV